MSIRALAILLALAACTPRPHDFGEGATDTATTTTTGTTTSTTGTTSTTSSSTTVGVTNEPTTDSVGTTSTSTAGPDDGSSTHSFIKILDGGSKHDCDVWGQDCPEGQKCMPYSGDGDNSWDSLKCVDVVPDPDTVGEPCTVFGSGVSGEDTCDVGHMCWDPDPDTGMGTCIPLCGGSPHAPQCGDPLRTCVVSGGGILNLCVPICDPLTGCPNGDLCIPASIDPGAFFCALDASGDEGQLFDLCEYANACDPGLHCSDPALAVECDPMAAGCCLPFCDLDLPDPCPGQGQQCLPWHDPGDAPPGLEDLGHCALP